MGPIAFEKIEPLPDPMLDQLMEQRKATYEQLASTFKRELSSSDPDTIRNAQHDIRKAMKPLDDSIVEYMSRSHRGWILTT